MPADQQRNSPSDTGEKKPLSGVKVIDAGHIIAGPLVASLLAEYGADVVSIEHPAGDPMRRTSRTDVSLNMKVFNRNKRAVTLDISTEEGSAVFKDLVKDADVVIENFRPGTMEKWGLGYEELSEINEDLIMTRISGFGQTGPDRGRAGFGRISGAVSGMAHLIGEEDGPPMFPSYPLEDGVSALYGVFGTLVALFNQRVQGGGGQVVDLAMCEALFGTNEVMPLEYDYLGEIPTRNGNDQRNVAPNSVYESGDGEYIVIPASNENAWRRLCEAMGREELMEDPKFLDNKSRVEHADEINGIVREWIGDHKRDDIEAVFDAHDVIYAFINDISDIFESEQFEARNTLIEISDDELGTVTVKNSIPKLGKTPGEVTHLGPKKGEHNEQVYQEELGYSAEQLERLRNNDVI